MSACLCCFAKETGLLLYQRCYGDLDSFPLPLLATLNSAHDYFKSLESQPISVSSSHFMFIWKEFYKRLRFLLIVKKDENSSDYYDDTAKVFRGLFLVLNLLHGKENIQKCKDTDVLRRYITESSQLLDYVVKAYLEVSSRHPRQSINLPGNDQQSRTGRAAIDRSTDLGLTLLLGAPLVAHPFGSSKITGVMDLFCSIIGVSHAFLLVSDRYGALSSSAQILPADDLLSLSCLVQSVLTTDNSAEPTERPVFLHSLSSDMAYRCFVFPVDSSITVTFLVGSDFILNDSLQGTIEGFWETEFDLLKRVTELSPSWMPALMDSQLSQEIYGVAIRNRKKQRLFVSTITSTSSAVRANLRRNELNTFIKFVLEMTEGNSSDTNSQPPIREIYRFSGDFKAYWLSSGDYDIMALFDAVASRQNLRLICEQTLTLFTTGQTKSLV